MKMLNCRAVPVFLILGWILASFPGIAVADEKSTPAVTLKLESVTLHAAGKGWFEYSGTIEGAGVFRVDVPARELDEVIRVSEINDSAGEGRIRMSSARDPMTPSAAVPDTRSLGSLLLSMKGHPVEATRRDGSKLSGILVSIEQRSEAIDDRQVERDFVTVLTPTGIVTAPIDDFITFVPTDAGFRARLQDTLAEASRPKSIETGQVEFSFADGPRRKVTIGMMRSTPMWKVSYRIEGDQLIHRSIVDNTTGIDWKNTKLNLADGSPVLFSMDLRSISRGSWQTLERPTSHVAVAPRFTETLGRQIDRESVAMSLATGGGMGMSDSMEMGMSEDMDIGMAMSGGMGGGEFGGGMGGSSRVSRSENPEDAFSRIAAQAKDAPAGSTLKLAFPNVSIADGQTALLDTPVAPISVERVSVYRQTYHPTSALLCLEIENKTNALLPSGPASVLDGSSAQAILGEVVLPALGPSAKRLLGYAMDGGVRVQVDPTESSSQTESIAVDSQLHTITAKTLHQRVSGYEVINRSGQPREIVLERPEPPRPFKFVADDKDQVKIEEAGGWLRIRFALPHGKTKSQVVREQHRTDDHHAWGTVDLNTLRRWAVSEDWDDATRKQLLSILADRSELLKVNKSLDGLLATRRQLISEIERVTNQLTRYRSDRSLPESLLQKYQKRIIGLEDNREKSELQMRTLGKQRYQLHERLGMDPTLTEGLSGLEAFLGDAVLVPNAIAE